MWRVGSPPMIADPVPEGPTETRKGWPVENVRADAPISTLTRPSITARPKVLCRRADAGFVPKVT
jgi:hypothetical protein